MKLQGRVAVVTGGGGGIGAAIGRALAEEGARVAVCDSRKDAAVRVADDIAGTGGVAAAYGFDVTDSAAVESAADAVTRELGQIAIWINNAGISRIVAFLECTRDAWDRTLSVNLTGTFIGCQAAIRRMLAGGRGVVINMSSQSGKTGNSHYAAYCASKFGIIGLTQSLALEFASRGLRINAVCPGVVFTPLWDGMVQDYAAKRSLPVEEVKPYLQSKVPLGRLCTPEDVARAVVFLASDDASFMTGQALNVSGGLEMH